MAAGHEGTTSVDYLPAEDGANAHSTGSKLGFHVMGDVVQYLRCFPKWDLMIAHPPCTYLTNAGARWLYENGRGSVKDAARWKAMEAAADFFDVLLNCNIHRIAVENPIPHRHAQLRQYSQKIQPYEYGHGETKATCLWLKNLPLLQPTNIVEGREARVHKMSPGPDRWKERSRTLPGIAKAMAEQWGSL